MFSFLDNGEGEDAKVGVDNATANRFPLSFAVTSWAVTGVTFGEEQPHSGVGQHSLFHRESLFVVATGNAEDIAGPFLTQAVGGNLRPHPLLIEGPQFEVIGNLKKLLRAGRRK